MAEGSTEPQRVPGGKPIQRLHQQQTHKSEKYLSNALGLFWNEKTTENLVYLHTGRHQQSG